MTTFRQDGTAIRLPSVMTRIRWLVGYAHLEKWMKRHQRRYAFCPTCGVARLKAAHRAHMHIHEQP